MRSRPSRRTFATATAASLSAAVLRKSVRAEQFIWKFGHDYPVAQPFHVRLVQAVDKVRADTGGQLDIKIYPDSALGDSPSMLSQLRVGALEMLGYAGGILDAVVPLASIESVAFAFPNARAARAAMDGDLGALIRQAILDKDIYVLDRVWEDGFREFSNNKGPIRSVDDLQGLRMRVSPSKLRVDTFRTLGVAITPIPSAEMYTGLQTHIIDGQESPLVTIESYKLFEVQKYCSLTHHMWGDHWILIDPSKWKSLPPSLQAIVRNRFNESAALVRRDSELLTGTIQDKLHRQGMAFNEPSQESFKGKLAAGQYYARWRTEFGDRAWTALEKYAGRLR